ncbi:hypothetical protein L6N65_001958 [Escherichia coli]|uniref:hypothetical protein n=1 Tax=Escherichia coli TaxID=562 RepID=UPI000CFDC252|nr:hypothetical protein [Escherichia coli]EIV0760928.1 hypothetical protein [Escherichia coli]EIV8346731.1 hypothetical protein [Escherichia coli]EKS5495584.1 hypothetical protein [Escherichia coli]ELD0455541.1 hypothetical protein [Escherichia coli]ELO3285839.1 hypothetical protein [Escherichia coli]
MKKLILSTLALTIVVASPAHAISAKYREQLERSGCTQMNAGSGCDINKTKEQNAAALKKAQDFSKFTGTYSMFAANGQRIGDKVIVVTKNSVKYRGHLAEFAQVKGGSALVFYVGTNEFAINSRTSGSWVDNNTNSGGTLGQ